MLPGRLTDSGFRFGFTDLDAAIDDVRRTSSRGGPSIRALRRASRPLRRDGERAGRRSA
ncbi:hypothetical protein [Agromyces silvae]|uniref:hypothetical protein n=1 Tax=Agromyces silvae TaxID=3388266 RepID=UPI0035A0CDBB